MNSFQIPTDTEITNASWLECVGMCKNLVEELKKTKLALEIAQGSVAFWAKDCDKLYAEIVHLNGLLDQARRLGILVYGSSGEGSDSDSE